jgi:hypothetical protein
VTLAIAVFAVLRRWDVNPAWVIAGGIAVGLAAGATGV